MSKMAIEIKAIGADAVVVLGAGLIREGNRVICSPQSKSNVEKGIELLTFVSRFSNEKKPLVFSGGFCLEGESEAEAMYKDFAERGFPLQEIYLETQSKNSYGNIFYCLNLVEKYEWRRITLIDQPMHLVQLKLLATKELRRRNLLTRIEFVAADPVWGNNIQKQWSSPTKFFMYQILSTGYYLLKGKIL